MTRDAGRVVARAGIRRCCQRSPRRRAVLALRHW